MELKLQRELTDGVEEDPHGKVVDNMTKKQVCCARSMYWSILVTGFILTCYLNATIKIHSKPSNLSIWLRQEFTETVFYVGKNVTKQACPWICDFLTIESLGNP